MPVVNIQQLGNPVSSDGLSQRLGLFSVGNVPYASGSVQPFCLFKFFNLNDKTKQIKKLLTEAELFKHTLALYPVSILSGPFPRAFWSLLT